MLARMAGLSRGKEVRNVMLNSGKVPDVAIFRACHSTITNIRTVVGADSRYCTASALFPGHGAVWVLRVRTKPGSAKNDFQDLRPPAAECGEISRGRSRH